MKKRLFAALAGALLLCAGCAQTAADPTPTPTAVVTPAPTESVEPAPSEPIADTEPVKYYENIGEETYAYQYTDVNIQIKYPYLCGPAEDEAMNTLLKQEALGGRLLGDEYDIRRGPGYFIGVWDAMRNDSKLLSIYYKQDYGSGGPNGFAHWGVTLDRETKTRLSLGDLVDTGTDFEAWLFAQDWAVQEQWQGGGDEIGADRAYVEQLIRQYLEYHSDPTQELRNFYITDTDLFLIVWVGKYDTHLYVSLADLNLKGGELWNG